MKTVIDARYIRPKPSGIGTYVENLVSEIPALAPADHFELWTCPSRRPRVELANTSIKPVFGDPQGPKTLFFYQLLPSLKDIDVFHSPHNVMPRNIPCASVVTVHDVMWLKTPQLVEKNSFLRVLSKSLFATGALRALKDASIIITVSNATRDDVLDIEPDLESRIRVIHNAPSAWCRPSDNLSQSHARAHALLGSSAPFFLVVGVNQPYKNHAATLRAFAQLPKTDAILVLVQRRASGRELIKLAQMLGIEKRVIFTKTQHRDDLLALLQAATALLHPSKAEGFGLPLLEAAACGCPVIATDIAPLREVLGEAGILVSHGPRLISELCAAMNQLLTNPSLREELRAKGLERAKGFSFGRSASRTLEAYRDAAALGPRRMQ